MGAVHETVTEAPVATVCADGESVIVDAAPAVTVTVDDDAMAIASSDTLAMRAWLNGAIELGVHGMDHA